MLSLFKLLIKLLLFLHLVGCLYNCINDAQVTQTSNTSVNLVLGKGHSPEAKNVLISFCYGKLAHCE